MVQQQSTELAELIDSTVSIPAIPTTLIELDKIFGDPDCNADDIAKIIEQDPGIAAKVLRLVNSSFYSLKNPITAIPMACAILGHRVIKNATLQASVVDRFEGSATSNVFDQIWVHSQQTAMAALLLVAASPIDTGLTKDDAYTCGLMHDIGKLVLQEGLGEDYQAVIALSEQEQIPLATAESRLLRFNHADVGGLLAREWRLSPQLCAAIQFHHTPSSDAPEHALGTLVSVANTVAHSCDAGEATRWRPHLASQSDVESLQIQPDKLDEIRATVASVSLG